MIIASKEAELEQRVDPRALDVSVMAQYASAYQWNWLKKHRDELLDAALQRIDEVWQRRDSWPSVPARVRQYCGDMTRQFAKAKRRRSISVAPLIPCLVYCAGRANISTHNLLFGTSKAVELPARLKCFLTMLNEMPAERRDQILQDLKDGFLAVNSKFFIMKSRLLELMSEYCVSARGLFPRTFLAPTTLDSYVAAMQQPVKPKASLSKLPDIERSRAFYRLVLAVCSLYGLSSDYLLLQDYSEYAETDHTPLPDIQKSWLSAFLCADRDSQEKAIRLAVIYTDIDSVQTQ